MTEGESTRDDGKSVQARKRARVRRQRWAAARKALCVFVSVVLVVGLMPGFAAWGTPTSGEQVSDVNTQSGEKANLLQKNENGKVEEEVKTSELPDSEDAFVDDEPQFDNRSANVQDMRGDKSEPEASVSADVDPLDPEGIGAAGLTAMSSVVAQSDQPRTLVVECWLNSLDATHNGILRNDLASSAPVTGDTISFTVYCRNGDTDLRSAWAWTKGPGIFAGSSRWLVSRAGITSDTGAATQTVTYEVSQSDLPLYFSKVEGVVLYLSDEPTASCSLTLSGNGLDVSDVTKTVTSGEEVTIGSVAGDVFKRDGYVLTGWNTAADGSGTPYSASGSLKVYADLTLYAQWAQVSITDPVANTGLVYSGTSQTLHSAGSTTYGTMQYSLDGSTYAAELQSAVGAGTHTIYFRVVGTDESVIYGPGSITATITKAPLTVTANDTSVTYGDVAPSYSVSYSGFKNGEGADVLSDTMHYACDYAQYDNAGSYDIMPSGVNSTNYEITFKKGTLTVNKKSVTVVADAKSKAYGETDPALTYTATGLVNGGTLSGALTRDAGEGVGTYAIRQGTLTASSNYELTFTGANLTITAATPDVTEPTAINSTYDGTEHALVTAGSTTGGTMVYSLEQNGTYTTDIPKGKDARTYTVWYKVVGDGNYSDTTPASVTATVEQREATLSWTDTNFKYDKQPHAPTATVSNLVSGDSCTVTVTGGQTNAGTYTATAATTALGNANYKLSSAATQSFTISPKTVGITWAGDSFVYDGQQHAPTATANDIVDGDTCNVNVSGEQTNAGGPYTATATLDNANYAIASDSGTHSFTIAPKVANLTWTDTSLLYSGAAQKPTATVSNLVSGDSCDVTVGGEQTHAGTYTATATGLDNANYTLVLATNTSTPYTITPKALTVTAKASKITYGEEPIGNGVDCSGFVGGDTLASLTGTLAYDSTYTRYGDVTDSTHSYTITPKGLTSADYNITFAPGTLTVEQREVTLAWSSPAAFDYRGSEITWDPPAVGNTVNGDSLTAVWAADSGKATSKATAAGTYEPEVDHLSGGKAGNYKLPSAKTGSWSINPPGKNSMTVTIAGWTYGKTANSPSVTADFGEDNVSYTYSDAENGTYTSVVPTNAGTYWVKASIPATTNYPEASATCKFTISKANITVTADDKQSVRATSGSLKGLTYAVGGDLVESDRSGLASYVALATTAKIDSAGSYPITVTKTAEHPNYNITTANGTYTITRALANVTATGYTGTYDGTDTGKKISVEVKDVLSNARFDNAGGTGIATIYYGTRDFEQALKDKGMKDDELSALASETLDDDDSIAKFKAAWTSLQGKLGGFSTSELEYADAGKHTVYFMIVSDQVTPDVIFGSKDVVINKAQLTITAKDKTIAYGANAANDGVEYSGFVNGETESTAAHTGTLAYAYGGYAAGQPVGNYAITPSGLEFSNYDVVCKPGTLTVGRAELTLTWPAKDSFKYTGAEQPYGPPTLSTPRAGDDVKVQLNAGTGTATNAGDYTATVAKLSGAAAGNYVLASGAQLSHDWSITPADLKVKAKDKKITYGDEPADGGAEYTTLLGADTADSLEGSLVLNVGYTRYGDAGSYKITPSGLSSPNYNITFEEGTLTVEPLAVTLGWPEPDEFAYTGSALSYGPPTLSGALNSDDVRLGTYSGGTATGSGTHTATVEGLDGAKAGNYKLPANKSHDWTIVGAANSATVTLADWTYGDAANEPVVTAAFGKDTAVITYASSEDGPFEAAVPTAAGTYWVKATIAASGNYNGAEATAKFTIAKRPVTVTAKQQVVEVGGKIATGLDQVELTGAASGDSLASVVLTGSSTAAATEAGTITPSNAVVKDAAGADMAANYDITYKPGRLIVAAAKTSTDEKVIYVLHKDIWMTVDEAGEIIALGTAGRDGELIDRADGHALMIASGSALPVIVKEDGGFVAVVGTYELVLKANPEVGVTAHVVSVAATDPATGITVYANDTTPDADVLRKAKAGDADAVAALIELAGAVAFDRDGNQVAVTSIDLSAVDPDKPGTYKAVYSTAAGASATANVTLKSSGSDDPEKQLDDLIKEAEDLLDDVDPDDPGLTDEQKKLLDEIEAAKKVLNDPNATPEQLREANERLASAIAAFKAAGGSSATKPGSTRKAASPGTGDATPVVPLAATALASACVLALSWRRRESALPGKHARK